MPEDQWFERKSSRIEPKRLAATMVALANADGGTIVVGLCDGAVEGFDAERLGQFQQIPYDHTEPPVKADMALLPLEPPDQPPTQLLIIEVHPSERVHELKDGTCYLRVGDETRRLRFQERKELEYDRGQAAYDAQPSDAEMDDLDHTLVETFKLAAGAQAPTTRVFESLYLRDPRDGRLNHAAALLFAAQPQRWHPEAYVRVIRFAGTTRGTGSRLNIVDGQDLRIEGPIPHMITGARDAIRELLPKHTSLNPDSGLFEPTPIVPEDAWLEGLVNAVVHRSYSLAGDHIRVEIYDDRIEIESPGRFPGLADPRKPREISRFARNPRIARVCAELRIGQEIGEGIRRMFDEMQRRGLTDPIYEERGGSVRLVLTNIPRLDPRTASRLPAGAEQLLDLLRASESHLSTGDIANLLGTSRPTVLRRLRALEGEGLIRWVGKSPRDPRAYWALTDRG